MMIAPISIAHNIQIFHCLTRILTATSTNSTVYSQIDLHKTQIPYVKLDFDANLTVAADEFRKEWAMFVLSFENDGQLRKNLVYLENSLGIHQGSKFVILGRKFTSDSILTLYSLFILHVLLVDVDTLEVFTYFPYKTKDTRYIDSDIYNLGRCDHVQDLFPDKSPEDWKNFTMYVAYRHNFPYSMCVNCSWKGFEIETILTVTEFLQINTHIFTLKDREEWQKAGESREYDVIFGNMYYTLDFLYYLYPFHLQNVAVFIPVGNIRPRWKYIFLALGRTSYVSFFIASLFLSLCFVAKSHAPYRTVIGEVFSAILTIFLDQNVISRMLLKRRYLVTFILFLGSMMSIFYKCGFTHLLSYLFYEKDIETLEELYSSDLKIGLTQVALSLFNQSAEADEYLRDHLVICDLSPSCVRRAATIKDMAVLKPILTMKSMNRVILEHRIGTPMRPIEPHYNLYQNTAMVPRGYLVYALMDKFCQRMVDHGFTHKIVAGYAGTGHKDAHKLVIGLSMKFFKAPMLLWSVGILIGIVVFFLEYVSKFI